MSAHQNHSFSMIHIHIDFVFLKFYSSFFILYIFTFVILIIYLLKT